MIKKELPRVMVVMPAEAQGRFKGLCQMIRFATQIFNGIRQDIAGRDGTAIGLGLATAVNRLKESEAVSKVVILLTDGVNNTGYQSPILAAPA